MAENMSGLGMSLKEWRVQNGEVTLQDACRRATERMRGAVKSRVELGELKVEDGKLKSSGEQVAVMDDYAWSLFSKLLCIPQAYLDRLGAKMKELNVNYWLQSYHDKEVVIAHRDMELLDIQEGIEIAQGDVLELLLNAMPSGTIIKAFQPTNAVAWDVIDERKLYEHDGRKFVPGMRVVVKEGLNAPEVNPMFLDASTCGEFEFAEYFEKLNIKSLGYSDILHVVNERICDCINARDHLFKMYESLADESVPNPKRRIALYCREHNLPSRVKAYALEAFDDSGLSFADFGDIISLFGTLGFVDEVKQSSERKLQKLAGHIVTHSAGEDRCEACDSLAVEM